jgi:hypothetical protein
VCPSTPNSLGTIEERLAEPMALHRIGTTGTRQLISLTAPRHDCLRQNRPLEPVPSIKSRKADTASSTSTSTSPAHATLLALQARSFAHWVHALSIFVRQYPATRKLSRRSKLSSYHMTTEMEGVVSAYAAGAGCGSGGVPGNKSSLELSVNQGISGKGQRQTIS